MNEKVIEIRNLLSATAEPMSAKEIAKHLNCTTQTVYNNMATAIANDFAVDTGLTRNGSRLYATPDLAMLKYFSVPWKDGERKALRDLFIGYAKTLPNDAAHRTFALMVIKLFRTAANYAYDNDNSGESYIEKIARLKEQRTLIGNYMTHLATLHKALTAVYMEDDLFDPNTVVKTLIMKDEQLSPQSIISMLEET